MAINPYFVGSSLDTIGDNMSRDYATDAQLRAAELQARNQFAAILQHAMQAQANRQQQGDQFNQELAFRNAALAQQGGLRGQELTQNQGQFDASLNYMRDALKQQLASQLELGKLQFDPARQSADPRVFAALIEQLGRNTRDTSDINAGIDEFNTASTARANQYNALLDLVNQAAPGVGRDKGSIMPWDPSERDAAATYVREQTAQLLGQLSNDKSAEGVSYDPVSKKFVPILRKPRPTAQQGQPGAGLGGILGSIYGGQTSTATNQPAGIASQMQQLVNTILSAQNGMRTNQFTPGGIYEQNGRRYRFDGTNFVELPSGQ